VPGGVIPVAKKPTKRVWYSSPQFRAAAAVLIVAGASYLVMRPVAEKSTLATAGKIEANEATTAQSAMSAAGPAAAAATAPVQPPVVADQTSKKEMAKPEDRPSPKGFAVLTAPVRARDAASAPPSVTPKITNEADFSGKGVKGGSANGVALGVAAKAPVQDTSAIASLQAMKADALSPRADFAAKPSELKVLHVDSSAWMKRIIYQTLSGRQVVFTEQPAESMLQEVVVTGVATESRKTAARAIPATPSPAVVQAPVAPSPSARNEIEVHTINWTDSSSRRRYSLTGPVSVEELEAIKARILKPKQ